MAAMPVRRRGPDAGRAFPAADPVESESAPPEAALLQAFAALPVGVLICTPSGDRANAALRRIWHAPDDAALDRRVVERSLRLFERRTALTAPQAGRPAFRPIHGALEGRAIQPVRAVLDRLDGSVGVVRVAAVPIDGSATPGAVLAVTDETAAHEVERLRDAFLGIVGHELRSPISSILGAAELLHDPEMDPTIRAEIVDDLGDEARRLHELVEQLIRLADLQRLAIEPTNEPAQLVHVVRRAIRRRHRRQPQLAVELELPDDVIPPVIGEDGYIEQAIDILVDNAAKYAGRKSKIIVRVVPAEGEVQLHVLDEGPGIPAGGPDAIFGLFHRAVSPGDGRTPPEGRGIGLFVARSIIEALGGRIWAENRPSGGADVGFALRVATE